MMTVEYLPVEGCEECEFFETACPECILYGEALKRAKKIGHTWNQRPPSNLRAKWRKKHGLGVDDAECNTL